MASSLATPYLRGVFAPLDITAKISDVSSDVRRFGGLADIYEGVLDADGGKVKVAIKFIRSNDRELEKIMRRHRREVKIWHDIKHPYILPLLGLYWSTRSLPAMVSTWCEYGNIRAYLQTLPSGSDAITRKQELLHQIAQGLAHLHGHTPPIVHGDLKGDNILVSDDGLPKICDFGLSKITSVTTETITHFRGTLRWMAPELLCDDPVATPASDIWAYGCITIEVFSGSRPFTEKASDNAVVLALSRRETPSRPEGMSKACWKLARKCFEYNPSKRIAAVDIIRDPVFASEPPFHSSTHISAGSGVWSPIQGIVSAAASAINIRQRKRMLVADPLIFPARVDLLAEEGTVTGVTANSEEGNSTAFEDTVHWHPSGDTGIPEAGTVTGVAANSEEGNSTAFEDTAHWHPSGDTGTPNERVSSDSESASSSDRDNRRTGSRIANSASDSNPIRTKVLYSYTASPDNPNELSLVKGEFVEVLDRQGKWWQAKNADGVIGIVPSNYLLTEERRVRFGPTQVVQIYRAKALYSYARSPDDPDELSFSKGEVIEILDKEGKWWQGRKADGSTGIVPSNYVQIL